MILSAAVVAVATLAAGDNHIGLALANPASVYCVQQGGRSVIVQSRAGARGLCVLPDGRRIDEWKFFRASRQTPR